MGPTQSTFYKVNVKTYQCKEIPLTGSKVFQLSVTSSRVYAIGEDATIEIAYKSGDSILNQKGMMIKDPKDSEDDDDKNMKDEETDYVRKSTKIEDIVDDSKETAEANNVSIIAGSDPEDEKEMLPPAEKNSEKSIFRSLSENDKQSRTFLTQ